MKWTEITGLIVILLATMAVGIGATAVGTASVAHEQTLKKYGYVTPGWYRGLDSSRKDVADLEQAARELEATPLYTRLSVGRFLIEAVDDGTRVTMSGYERAAGTHDLSRVAGRAAYYLEHALPLTLPTITEATSEAELEQIQASARQQYEAYRAGVMDMVRTYDIGGNPEALARRYRDAIYVGVAKEHHSYQFFPEGRAAFERMLHEFFPVGKTLAQLEEVMGGMAMAYEPDLKTRDSSEGVTGVFEYYYTDRMFGESYFFLVEDGIITVVNVRPSS